MKKRQSTRRITRKSTRTDSNNIRNDNRSRVRNDNRRPGRGESIVFAPFNEALPAEERTRACIEMSEMVTRLVTYVICHTIVNNEELFKNERTSIAHAILQRVTSTHMCNHKLTTEGIVYRVGVESFQLHEEYKTMTLTRSVYEHLAMFYFLFEHPQTDEERDLVWQSWQTNGKINMLERAEDGTSEMKQVSYSQAWRYLFKSREMAQLYKHLSMHCHPVYQGLVQYQSQSVSDQGEDAIPLYLSCCFLAYMCRLFMKLLPDGDQILKGEFDEHELYVFERLSQTPVK